ncbi:hypothetical protein [Bacillus atrophaeus]|uniref:hypothetical protein n=1 Tax=Bacillus atrophaeus TaxID=1452 RepID=UPI000C058AD7|nr:hypothetical protein [Bacillus atrophaeus]ATO28974.1 hypothetical protein RA13_13965 [Bacillus atrophaeus]MCY8922108.1 hypothetical protein [Bacillus atrophaeus]MCY8934395.1 hypothetical protein [Bacillus atrophaeus]MCY8943989.1 hypothetical protein [Bacillus atrophaeus]
MLLDEKLNKLNDSYVALLNHKSNGDLRRVIGEFHSIIDYAYEGMYITETILNQEGEG